MTETLVEVAPTAGQRYVQARSLRAGARTEISSLRGSIEYMLTDAGPDPENARFAAGYRAALDLWIAVEALAVAEMDRWREEARQFSLEWGDGE